MKTLIQQDGDPITVTVPARKASGYILFSDQPDADSTITLNGVVFTFKASGAAGNQSNIGANLNATLDALVTVLNASSEADVEVATYSSVPATATALYVSFDTAGAAGNDFTLAASAASNGVVSGPTLTHGAGVTSGEGIAIGCLFGVSAHTALSGVATEISCRGVYTLPKTPTAALAAGAICWWAPDLHEVVPATATGNLQIGIAVAAAAATDTSVNVLLGTRPAAGV